jgi:hypothetical protein
MKPAMLAFAMLLCVILMHIVQAAPQEIPATIEFNRDIRPILSDKCFQCHGPALQSATLRFDLEDGAKHALSGGRFAIVPGNPANSQLIQRVTATDPAVRMPRNQEALSEKQVALLTRWIEQGAKWQKHWSFIPPKRPEPPKGLKDAKWVRNPIDAFVLERLEREGRLKPSAEADRATLLRRVRSTLRVCRRHPPSWMLSSRIHRRTHMKKSSIDCYDHHSTASAWRSRGSTRHATPTATATKPMASGSCGGGAIG